MKIPIQQKIAELEGRIWALEQAVKLHANINQYTSTPFEPKVREHWNNMWNEFNLIMKQVFK